VVALIKEIFLAGYPSVFIESESTSFQLVPPFVVYNKNLGMPPKNPLRESRKYTVLK